MTKEEKDKLIELSDLNREDNIKYISSEAQGIAITLDMDRYAPTFCKLERAYICGRRKSEKQIEELEKENRALKSLLYCTKRSCNNCGKVSCENFQRQRIDCCGLWVSYKDYIKELEKENAGLKDELAKWKDEWQEQVQKAIDEGYARTQQTIQLTNAKEHIKQLLDCLKQDTNDPQTNYYVCQYMDKAEQFIKDSEVEK